jgi:HNH endonuclease
LSGKVTRSAEERFWEKVARRGADDCWEWKATRSPANYGRFYINGRYEQASRVAWTLANGEIPSGLWVLHKCDNPPCVNPNHLFLGDRRDNMIDCSTKRRNGAHLYPERYRGCAQKTLGEQNGQSKLSANQVREIRRMRREEGLLHREIAAKFGVTGTTVAGILSGKYWRHVS